MTKSAAESFRSPFALTRERLDDAATHMADAEAGHIKGEAIVSMA